MKQKFNYLSVSLYRSTFVLLFLGILFNLLSCKKKEITDDNDINPSDTNFYLNYSTGLKTGLPAMYAIIPKAYTNPVSLPVNTRFLDMPPAGNQFHSGSCVGWAIAYGVKSNYRKLSCNIDWMRFNEINPNAVMSPSYIFNIAKLNYSESCDSGITVIDGLLVAQGRGVCTMNEMDYTTDCSLLPNAAQDSCAKRNRIGAYYTLPEKEINSIKNAIYDGYPVIIAAHLNQNFVETKKDASGYYIWKDKNDSVFVGYHCMVIYGFDDNVGAFKVLNSWGGQFKNEGSIWIDYSMFNGFFIDQLYIIDDYMNYCQLTYPNDSIADFDNNKYGTIQLGSQYWMTENLKVEHFQNGDIIQNNLNWNTYIGPAWAYWNNDPSYNIHYGKWYNYDAANDTRKICPNGWHIPSLEEWETLMKYLNANGVGVMEPTQDWLDFNTFDSTYNIYKFSAYPSGYIGGNNDGVGHSATFWTSKMDGISAAYYGWIGIWIGLGPIPVINYYYGPNVYGRTCRCLKD